MNSNIFNRLLKNPGPVPMGLRLPPNGWERPSAINNPIPGPFAPISSTGGFNNGSTASANSTGGGTTGSLYDFSGGIPAKLLNSYLEVDNNHGVIRNQTTPNANSWGTKFGEQNANSYWMKNGLANPDATKEYNTPIPVDVYSRAAAVGQKPTWGNGQWNAPDISGSSRGGPNYAASPDYSQGVNNVNQAFWDNYNSLMNGGYPGFPHGRPGDNLVNGNTNGQTAALTQLLKQNLRWR